MIARLLSPVLLPLLLVLLALASVAAGWQHWITVPAAQRAATTAAAERDAARLERDQAREDARTAHAGQEAAALYAQDLATRRPDVDRLAARILRQCAGETLPLPGAASGVDDPARGAADPAGFAADLAEDLRQCTADLDRLRRLQGWIEAVRASPP